jgi:hypothetical protein
VLVLGASGIGSFMMENTVLGGYRDQAGDDTWRARS